MDSINTNNPNILDQLTSYNSADLDSYLSQLNIVLSDQSQLNSALKDKNHDDNITYVQNFISRNKNQIEYQLEEIQKLTQNIHDICLKNKELQNEKQEYKDLIESVECIDVAKQLSEIKKLKENMKAFLLKKGIHL